MDIQEKIREQVKGQPRRAVHEGHPAASAMRLLATSAEILRRCGVVPITA